MSTLCSSRIATLHTVRLSARNPRSAISSYSLVRSSTVQRSFFHGVHYAGPGLPGHIPSVPKTKGYPSHRPLKTMVSDASRMFTRGLSSSDQRSLQDPIKDPSHPSLYYHFFDVDELAQPVFCLSFLDIRPRNVNSQTVLGWLPVLSQEVGGNENAGGLNDFVENKSFPSLLHEAIQKGLLEDEIWKNSAIQTQSGWMHVFDQRNPPPLGRIPDADDILASVRVEDGRMLIGSYQPMPSYRLCTGDGVCQLTDGLFDQLKLILNRIIDEEKESF